MTASSTLILPTRTHPVARDLRALLGAEKVKDDVPTVTAYAVDASIYRIPPQAVVLVESEDDIATTVGYAVSRGIPLTPRAAGTNLTGSAIGSGIILDVSHLNRILEVNREERWARVQPGIVLAELNKQLSLQGLLFGPDPSSGDMCKLGGMVANNSSGPHTLRYGSVKDNVQSLRLCLTSSSWIEARSYALDDPALERLLTTVPALRDVLIMTQAHAELIAAKRPTVSKNSCGYNLFGLASGLARGSFDLQKLFVGSEGTLGVVSEARLTLVDKPKATMTALIHFQSLEEVGEAVPQLLMLQPSALEVMDANTLNLIGREKHGIPADAAATLLVELDADSLETDLCERAEAMAALCRSYKLASEPTLAFDAERREQLWKARKALYPTLYRFDPKKKPINFVDDVVVPAGRISELIRYLEDFFEGQRVPVAIFGHIGNGNAHIVPLLDVNDRGDFAKMVSAYRDIHTTVLNRFDGSICGEHGDGRVRAEFVKEMFGEELYDLFVQVKKSFDPGNVLNPGIKLSGASFTDHIDYTRLSKSCATCAKCNSVCPVYDVFQSEDMSSRGWFEIVTAKDYSYLNSKRVVEACLNCKSCRTICPAGVDVSDLILQKRAEHPNRLAGWIFRQQAKGTAFESFLRFLGGTQRIWDRPFIRRLLEQITTPIMKALAPTARLPHDLMLPKLAPRHLRERYAHLIPNGTDASPSRSVAYFHGCAANYFDDGVGDAVMEVLKKHGVEPALPPQRCSGTPIQTYGHVDLVRDGARYNIRSLTPYETIVTGCASCTLMLKDYPALFPEGSERQQAEELAKKVVHISEFVARSPQHPPMAKVEGTTKRVTYHSSCHLRAAGVTKEPRQVLSSLPGVDFVEMQDADRCAGGAGTYLIKDYDTSQKIFDRKARAIAQADANVVATSCPACMIQLKNGVGDSVQVQHIAQLLKEAYQAAERERS
ncbi:MAG: FAD-binding and (Fe-S)-binding domain-containing protein [Nitrospira sp.]|jgi:FAD/FMN-containing dehydrogenase/Fe-S oxidoreductase|nr:MAG: FAD-binding and (Fe-S)-binding domain-containing protein [Nitrospira sp.]